MAPARYCRPAAGSVAENQHARVNLCKTAKIGIFRARQPRNSLEIRPCWPVLAASPATCRAGTAPNGHAGGGLFRALTYVGQLLAVGVGYYLLDVGAVRVVVAHPNAVAFWPPAGLAFAAVMLGGYRMLPAVFVAAFLTHAVPFGPSDAAAVIAAGNTLEAFMLGSLVDGWAEGRTTFATTRGIARFVPIAMIAAAVGASVASGTDVLLPVPPRTEPSDVATFAAVWVPWWLRDVTAALVITPALVLWATERPRGFDFSSALEATAIIAATAAVGALLLGPLAVDVPNRAALAF